MRTEVYDEYGYSTSGYYNLTHKKKNDLVLPLTSYAHLSLSMFDLNSEQKKKINKALNLIMRLPHN